MSGQQLVLFGTIEEMEARRAREAAAERRHLDDGQRVLEERRARRELADTFATHPEEVTAVLHAIDDAGQAPPIARSTPPITRRARPCPEAVHLLDALAGAPAAAAAHDRRRPA